MAEAQYWFGHAWIANGEVKRDRWMVAEARTARRSRRRRRTAPCDQGSSVIFGPMSGLVSGLRPYQ
jgi:hypothetical protein